MSEMLTGPKKIVDGLTEVFRGLTQMCEGMAEHMLNTFEVNKVLIIAPLRVARDTWPAEIEKWDHLKNLDI